MTRKHHFQGIDRPSVLDLNKVESQPKAQWMPHSIAIISVPDSPAARPWGDKQTVLDVAAALISVGHSVEVLDYTDDIFSQIDPNDYDLFIPNGHHVGSSISDVLLVSILEGNGAKVLGHSPDTFSVLSDKIRLKRALDRSGIPTPAWHELSFGPSEAVVQFDRFPALIKPSKGSDSRGIFYVDDWRTAYVILQSRFDKAMGVPIIEQWHRREEYTVSVIGNEGNLSVACLKMILSNKEQFLSPERKSGNLSDVFCPVEDKSVVSELEYLALSLFRGLSLRDWCRFDVVSDGTGMYVIDVNALPGLRINNSSPSLLPLAFLLVKNQTYRDTLNLIINSAIAR